MMNVKNGRLLISAFIITAVIFGACNKNDKSGEVFGEKENLDKNESYALGMSIGAGYRDNMASTGIFPNVDEFIKGMRDGMSGGKGRFELAEAEEMLDIVFSAIMDEKLAPLVQQEKDFLTDNAKKSDIIIRPSGLQYEILVETTGPKPAFTDMVKVNYEGRLIDGQIFSSTYDYGEPISFALNQVIPGWSEGLQLMSAGSKYRFFIPSEIAYGASGEGPIPPYSTLIFVVELLEIIN